MSELQSLYDKVDEFFKSVESRYSSDMSCTAGCARCCYVDLSVFSIEVAHIKAWFKNLSPAEQVELKKRWQAPAAIMENFQGQQVSACAFLKDNLCTIYEARPLICRSQGLPLKFKTKAGAQVDACPLNFTDVELELSDCLDLDRVNLILAHLEKTNGSGERVSLTDLQRELAAL